MTPREAVARDEEAAKATAVDAARRGTLLLAQVAVQRGLGRDTAEALERVMAHERDWWFLAAARLSWASAADEGTSYYLRKALEVAVDEYFGEGE